MAASKPPRPVFCGHSRRITWSLNASLRVTTGDKCAFRKIGNRIHGNRPASNTKGSSPIYPLLTSLHPSLLPSLHTPALLSSAPKRLWRRPAFPQPQTRQQLPRKNNVHHFVRSDPETAQQPFLSRCRADAEERTSASAGGGRPAEHNTSSTWRRHARQIKCDFLITRARQDQLSSERKTRVPLHPGQTRSGDPVAMTAGFFFYYFV